MKLPLEYRWLKAHKFEVLTPWYLIDPLNSEELIKEYQLETGKDIVPFARRQDNDDIAGFEIIDSEIQRRVLTVHLTWKGKREIEGYPIAKISPDLFEWIKDVMFNDTKDWMNEDELADLLN